MFDFPSCGKTLENGLMIFVQLDEYITADGAAREKLTMLSVTAIRQALWSSGDKREKFLSHQAFTK